MECQDESCYVCQRQPRSWCVNRLLPINQYVHIPPFIDNNDNSVIVSGEIIAEIFSTCWNQALW